MIGERDDTDELLRRAGAGETSATELLWQRYRSRLRHMVQVRLSPELFARVDPSDIVQETLVEASQKLDAYVQQRPLPFYPWLRQIAWRRLTDTYDFHFRAAKRTLHREARWRLSNASSTALCQNLAGSLPSPSHALLASERCELIRRLLDQLSENDREVLVLRYIEQLSSKEIAAVLEIGEGAVKMRQLRALEHLRSLWEKQGD